MTDLNLHALISDLFGPRRRHSVQVESEAGGEWSWVCFDCELVTPTYRSLEIAEADADGHAGDPSGHPMHRLDGGPR